MDIIADKVSYLEDGGISDNVDNGDPAASVYELLSVKMPGGKDFDYLGTVLKGCSIVSLAGLFTSLEIWNPKREMVNNCSLEKLRPRRVKCPHRGAKLYIKYQDAAGVCQAYSRWKTAPGTVNWLEKQALVLPENPADRHRLQLLEAIDMTKYISTLLGKIPRKGGLVLLRASDGHMHVACL